MSKQTSFEDKIPKSSTSAINFVFVFFLAGAIIFAAWKGSMKEITDASFESAKSAVNLAINLIGIMALWLGMVRVLEAGGLMQSLARFLKPLMTRLFPEVPAEHPAMSTMILNIAANMLGLGNAATPFGLRAMVELNRLNPIPGTATNAMCLFLAINTSSVALFPLGVIGVRAAAGSAAPAAIWAPTLLATIVSTIVGISAAMFFAARDRRYAVEAAEATASSAEENLSTDDLDSKHVDETFSHLSSPPSLFSRILAPLMMLAFLMILGLKIIQAPSAYDFLSREVLAFWLMPALMLIIVSYGVARGVKIYEAVTEGAKQGFEIAVRIIPFLVAILVAIGMFRASGAMDLLVSMLEPFTSLVFMPAETLPMALVRPLSGSGAFGIMSDLIAHAPDSYAAYTASTMMGSTETTFYVLAVYFGAAGIFRIRHALAAALLADAAGILSACFFSRLFY